MDVDGGHEQGHDHRFGTGAHGEPPAGDEAHHGAGDVHGLIEHIGVDISHLTTNLEHLPLGEPSVGLEHALDHDFGTHHDGADGLHGLHDSIHHESVHLAFSGEEHHGLADLAHDPAHDDPSDHHHHDTFGLGGH